MHSPIPRTEKDANFSDVLDFGLLDFGILEPGENQVRQVQIEADEKVTGTCKVTYSEPNAWFRIVSTQPLSSTSLFPLSVSIAVDTDNLPSGRRYDGWLLLTADGVNARIALTIQVGKLPVRPRFARPRRLLRFVSGISLAILLASLCFYLLPSVNTWWHGRQESNSAALYSYSSIFLELLKKRVPQSNGKASEITPTQLAFSVYEGGKLFIYLAQADGGQQERLGIAGWSPVWSPDGKYIAFLAEQTGAPQLYVMDLAHREPVQLTNSLDDKSALVWSPDQTKIAFVVGESGHEQLKIVNVPAELWTWSRNQPTITQAQTDRLDRLIDTTITGQQSIDQPIVGVKGPLFWSSDSKALLFGLKNRGQTAVYQAKSAQIKKLSLTMSGWDPAWSPTASTIAIGSDVGIFLLDNRGQNPQAITSFSAWSPLWSPDGEQLAFLSDQDNPPGKLDLWITDRNGRDPNRLTTSGCLYFVWSPDGERLAYISGDPTVSTPVLYLWLMKPGEPPKVIAEVGEPHVAW